MSFEGLSFNEKEKSCLAGSLFFSGSLRSSYLVVDVSLAFCTFVAIRKHYWASCWSPYISSTVLLVEKRMRRHLVKIIEFSKFSHGHPRMMLYAEGNWMTMNVMKIVLCHGTIL